MHSRKRGAICCLLYLMLWVGLSASAESTDEGGASESPAPRKKWGEVDPQQRGPDYVPGLPSPLPPLANPKPRDQVRLEDVLGSWEVTWGSGMSFLMSFMPDNQLVLGRMDPGIQKSLKYEFDASVPGSLRVKFWDVKGIRTCPPEQIGIYEIQLSETCNEMRFILVEDPCWRRSKARPRMTLTRDPPVLQCKSQQDATDFPVGILAIFISLFAFGLFVLFFFLRSTAPVKVKSS